MSAAPSTAPALAGADRGGGLPEIATLALIFAVSLAVRLVVLPGSTPLNMDPDAAHFLNIARCMERGQGFSNVGAWPAWMKPDSLPMPETFKEPGYPWLIWKLKPLAGGDPFRAGLLVSMLGGLAIPLLTYALGRSTTRDRAVALVAGLVAAGSPVLAAQSVRVMVDSIFPALVLAAFAIAAWRPGGAGGGRRWPLDVGTGVALGLAFLMRGGALIVLLPLLVLTFQGRRFAAGARGALLMVAAAGLTASPFILRNLRLFHTWYHSDVGAYGIWPYVDRLMFHAGLDHPPAPLGFVLHHLPLFVRHWLESAARFGMHAFPEEILGHQWLLPCAAGLLLSLPRWRSHLFAYVHLVATTTFIFAVSWDSRYFTSTVPLWSLYAGLGAVWMWRRLGSERVAGRLDMRPALVALFALTLLVQLNVARQWVRRYRPPEIGAAATLGPEFHRRLAPGESVMVITTSLYAWFADRPTVHLVIADPARFLDTVRRLRVKLACLPTDRLAEFAAHYPGGRLPEALVFERAEPGLGVTVFRVEAPAADGARAGR